MKTSKELYDFIQKINNNLQTSDDYKSEVIKSLGKCLGMLKVLAMEIEVTENCLLTDVKAN